ncbi:amino acid/amide ABC transporter ATP-binding protein 2, HAAT family [Thermomonospora echinospora]|uniref:Amino acid/amide ABC transporter ATP-binding protein 2, HAAT family n=1 Tax=Thermomonospora echinospora TaxID=1992 RepID=A0A1H6E8R8_9ACTN|nr:ABC transporter ATP-binding protein [Thermomonospora echinospora]SEG93519.1 amino acid/amide ABC transporter ATP-binding protein 2, HAAT family [Thermomonospora echinospora]
MSPVLEVRGLTAGYGSLTVLRDVGLTVGEGEIVVVLGANGAGKTTTLRALSGLIPAQGSVVLSGTELLGRKADARARLGLGHAPEGRGTFTDLTVDENLRMGGLRLPRNELPAALDQAYGLFPQLTPLRDRAAGRLSGGEQQMLTVARALMARPRLLLLDEPSMGLAPQITANLFAELRRVNAESGTAMLLVEQNAAAALTIAHHGHVLESGHIVLSGTGSQLAGNPSVRRAYLGV